MWYYEVNYFYVLSYVGLINCKVWKKKLNFVIIFSVLNFVIYIELILVLKFIKLGNIVFGFMIFVNWVCCFVFWENVWYLVNWMKFYFDRVIKVN